jgi:YD repeat-containing protein
MTRFFAPIALAAIALALLAGPVRAQSIADYREFHRMMRLTATERLAFCYPTTTQASDPISYGVERDTLGRPVRVTRFRFGNPDTKSEWTTMRVSYTAYEPINTVIEHRTFFNASGMPVTLQWAYAEEVYRRGDGELVQRKIVDRAGKAVNDSAGVHRALFKPFGEAGTIIQEWAYSNLKVHYGTGSDGDLRPFAPMSPQTYFRKFTVDASGNLLREEIWDFDRKPIPYPGGELARAYELDNCGLPVKVSFLDADGRPMADSLGTASIAYTYDDAGRVVAWTSYGTNGKPVARLRDGTATMRFTYRAFDGVLLKQERLDADGDPVGE